jgi:hypothetical protein
MSIIIFHIIATFDYYVLLTKLSDKITFFQKISPKLVTLIVFIFSSLCYLYLIFTKELKVINLIEINERNESINMRIIYQMKTTQFWDSNLKKILEIVIFFVRDGLNLSVLVILNVLIYFRVIKVIRNKIILKNSQNHTSKTSCCLDSNFQNVDSQIRFKTTQCGSTDQCIELEKKITIMVFAGCLNHLIGRLPILISFILKNSMIWNRYLVLFDSIAVTSVYISYMLNFFIFYLTNNRFKKLFKKYLKYFKISKR